MLRKTKKGFTLIELIVVVVVLAILAAVAVPMVSKWTGRAEKSQAEINRRTIELAIRTYMAQEGIDELTSSNIPQPPRDVDEDMMLEGNGMGLLRINPANSEGLRINTANSEGLRINTSGGGLNTGGGRLNTALRVNVTGLLLEYGIANPIPGSKSNYKVTTGGSVTVTDLGEGWGYAYVGEFAPPRPDENNSAENILTQSGQN